MHTGEAVHTSANGFTIPLIYGGRKKKTKIVDSEDEEC